MAIEVTCPNGHLLRVKNKYAGQAGLCPVCQARVQVPENADDKVVEWLGGATANSLAPAAPVAPAAAQPLAPAAAAPGTNSVLDEEIPDGSGVSLLRSGIIRHVKKCKCSRTIPIWYATCPHCGEHFQV